MGQFDYLVPGSSTTAPVSKGPVGGQFASLVPKAAPVVAPTPVTPGPINRAVDPFVGNLIGGAEKLGSDVFGALTAPPAPPVTGPLALKTSTSAADDIATSAVNTYANAFTDAANRFSTAFNTVLDSHSTALQKGVSAGEAGMGALNLAFSPLSSFINATSHIPVLGALSVGLNNVFGAIGAAGSDLAEGGVDAIPKSVLGLPVSDETKATLMPLAKEIGALTAQIVAGKGGEEHLQAVGEKTNEMLTVLKDKMAVANPIKDSTGQTITPNPVTKLPVTGDTTPTRLPVTDNSPTETAVTPSNQYTPDAQLPVIDAGNAVKDTTKMGSYTVEPIKTPDIVARPIESPIANEQPASSPITEKSTAATETPSIKSGEQAPINGNKVSGVADTIEATALRKQIVTSIPEKAGYNSSDFDTQSKLVADFINNEGIDAARAAVKDETAMPRGMKSGALIQGLELYADKHPDVAGQIYREIAASHLTSTISEGASETSFARMISRESPSMAIKDAIEKKAGGAEGTKKIAAEAKKAKSTITKAAAKMMDYQSVVDAIKTC